MKKPLLVIIMLICVIVGCKLDDTGLPQKTTANPLLVGTWFVKTQTTVDQFFGIDVETGFTAKDYYIFNNDNTTKYSSSFHDTLINGRYTYVNNASGQKLTIGAGSGFTTFTIDKLTADSLIISTTISVTAYGTTTTTTTDPLTYKLAHK